MTWCVLIYMRSFFLSLLVEYRRVSKKKYPKSNAIVVCRILYRNGTERD